jgi:hypothetical protein
MIVKKISPLFFVISVLTISSEAQLKYIIEDFEGLSDGASDLKANGLFTFGNMKANVDYRMDTQQAYSGERYLRLNKNGKMDFGGWGKGMGVNVELDPATDYLNFYVYPSDSNNNDSIKIELQEDDNDNNTYDKKSDDSWIYQMKLEGKNAWELISIPLNKFKDANSGGDGVFNVNYKQGKLFCFIINFLNTDPSNYDQHWSFDFICFSKGKLLNKPGLFEASLASPDDFCNLGVWSKEGNMANFVDIANNFENHFKYGSEKKLGVVHFFQPFAFDGGDRQNLYPSVERINKVIQEGYIPMITLEDHFVNAKPTTKQPNLYSIVEGHFDSFFASWAKQIKEVNGIVLLRILHEFNGDWYPWCTVNNDKNPQLLIKAFQRIHTIFKEQQVTNVRFIWCPNSTSFPQEKWNFVMNAYPGDEFVDFVGLDIYNGAGKNLPVWRSFRKEAIENYFVLTERLPNKPLLVCETASREREGNEPIASQNKAQWIKQMGETLRSDMSKIRLICWFNEKKTFHINSSIGAQGAFLDYIMKNEYFKAGAEYMYLMLGH